MPDTLLITRADTVATVMLNRPDLLNAINSAMVRELVDAFRTLDADEGVRAVVLTGAGERAFCTGMDLKERHGMSDADLVDQRVVMAAMFGALRRCGKPVIAAANGYTVGGGLELALSADFIYAATTAVFGLPEVTRGIMPGGGATALLPRRIGAARARELIYTGALIDADEAARIGLVNRVLPPAELLAAAQETARVIAANAPIGVRQSKRAMLYDPAIEAGIAFEGEAYRAVLYSADRREGYAAFNEKRPPRFQGR
ncbi:MAG: enoyl-CoA hydratase/isomerase family protein [Chloroflexi bacterium]|nr:enoyl-CoA hydratase/isomerase family protein [Chloroflexota bacterium]